MPERQRTIKAYNLDIISETDVSALGFPLIESETVEASAQCPFNMAKTYSGEKGDTLLNFFVDDYQFERIWNRPKEYVELVSSFAAACTPDFSLYTEMPIPMQIWNVFRSRAIGRFWQSKGIVVIPTLQWSDERSFDFCFDGLPEGGDFAVSAIGCMRDAKRTELWRAGMGEAVKRLKPRKIYAYGKIPDFDDRGCEVVEAKNSVIERMENGRKRV